MQLLDTSTLPRHERADAVSTLMHDIALASRVVHDDPADVFMVSRQWALGPVNLVRIRPSGMFMDVSRDRDDRAPAIAMMLGSRAGGLREQFGHTIEARAGVVDLIEQSRPHQSWIRRNNSGWCLTVPLEALALPERTVTRARPGLAASPIHRVFALHLKELTRRTSELADDGAAEQLGAGTVALARALISSAGDDPVHVDDSLHEALLWRIRTFVHEHLHDPCLNADAIAAAHSISVRLLYKICADAGVRLEQWIIDQRLDGAWCELTSPRGRHRSVAAVAHHWGFSTHSHFHRRFRQKYGITPRECQRRLMHLGR